jgi:hypothetical protein
MRKLKGKKILDEVEQRLTSPDNLRIEELHLKSTPKLLVTAQALKKKADLSRNQEVKMASLTVAKYITEIVQGRVERQKMAQKKS